jgi:hypothetical protein
MKENMLGLDADAMSEHLARERAFALVHNALVVQDVLTLTVLPVYSLKSDNFLSCMDMLVGKSVARLRSSAKPWPG